MGLTRKIGEAEFPAMGFGAMAIGGWVYGVAGSDEERFKILDRIFELGFRHWDTASVYGDSEELLGKWFERTGNRDKIFLATKFGFAPDLSTLRGDPEFVKSECAKSLERLKTNYIDLYYQHRPDKNVPIEITVGAMVDLIKEGKVKYLGLSEASPSTIRRAHAVHPIGAIQIEYSPFELTLEKPGGILHTARELGISTVAYSPTGRGLASGKYKTAADYNDWRSEIPKFTGENWQRILEVINSLKEIADAHNATPAQVCLAWLLAQGDDIILIPGSKQIKYCEENWEGGNIRLSDAEVKRIRVLADAASAHDDEYGRYPPAFKAFEELLNVDTPPLPK